MSGFPITIVSLLWSREGGGGRVARHLPQRSRISVPLSPAEEQRAWKKIVRTLLGWGFLGTQRQSKRQRHRDTQIETDRQKDRDRSTSVSAYHLMVEGADTFIKMKGSGIGRLCLAVTLGEIPLN